MSAWFHWIGKEYYTIKAFQREAVSVGISRRVSLKVLQGIEWGDTVMCLQCEYRIKAGSMFLEFPVEVITGLTQEGQRIVADKFFGVVVDLGCSIIHRDCGEYMTGLTYRIDAPISEIAGVLQEAKAAGGRIGKPMIGCYPHSVIAVQQPYARLKDVPFTQGFRRYNREDVMEQIAALRADIDTRIRAGQGVKQRRPILRGQFYTEDETEAAAAAGDVQTALNYRRKGG